MENTAEHKHAHFTMMTAPRTLPDTCTVFPGLPPFLLQDPHYNIFFFKMVSKYKLYNKHVLVLD